MTHSIQNSRVFSRIVFTLLGSLLSGSQLLAQTPNTSIFSPASTPAGSIHGLAFFVLAITAGIFLVVASLLAIAVIRFRARKDEENLEPPQVFGSTQIELSWTIIPVLIIVVLFLTTARMIFAIQDAPKPKSALDVIAVGHQFWWEFRYPKLGVVTANELHIPVSSETNPLPTYFQLASADVDHSFWVPNLSGKIDLIPNRVNELWMDPQRVGLYKGQCAQFCGAEHAKMLLRVYVETPEQFQTWVQSQLQPAIENPAVEEGRRVFETQSCINCHRVAGTVANGRFGPDLTHLMSRHTIAAGAADNTPENLKAWIADPSTFKAGCLMPAMQLTGKQLDQITAYLATLK